MSEPQWLDEREQRAWRSLLTLMRELSVGMERQLTEAGLSGADFQLLVPLSEAEDGGLRARDLGQVVGWDRSRLSHQVRRMEERGLVSRSDCADDARGTVVRITDAGRQVVESAAPGHVEWVRAGVFDALGDDDVDALTAIAQRVVARLQQDQPPACT